VFWVRESSNDSALSAELDTTSCGGLSLCEVWIESNVDATFSVFGSVDGVNWRWMEDLTLPCNGRTDRHVGYHNAYHHLKVSTDTVGTHDIEIVAGA